MLVKKEKETHAEVKTICINKISSVVTHFENKKEVQIEVQERFQQGLHKKTTYSMIH